ncbi:MAG TPA: response regulator [Anaeromyxobacteraceae bacterium]|nr:response regulator [Anaeromyxobacteraceae bacterium]
MRPLRTGPNAPDPAPRRILLVEDEPALAEILEAFLRSGGRFEVVLARDADEAIRKARQSPPDVAVLDLEVRDLDGEGLLRTLREDHTALPALACDGAGGAGEPESGFDALFVKPLDLTALLAQVERLVDGAGRGRP